MSKFIIIICAILFAGAVCAEDVGTVMKMKNEVVVAAKGAYNLLEGKLKKYSGPIKDLIVDMKGQAKYFRQIIYDKIVSVENQVTPKIDKVLAEASGSAAEECAHMAKSLQPLVSKTYQGANQCLDDRVEKAVNTWKNVFSQSQEALTTLVQVENDVELCVSKIVNWRSATSASYCVTKVAAIGTWQTATNVPRIVINIGDLYLQIQRFLPQLKSCATIKAVEKLKESGEETLKNVITCVKAKKSKKSEKSWLNSIVPW